MTKRVVLAYSGGLDTSVAIRWMIEEWGVEVVGVLVNVGQDVDSSESFDDIRDRALAAGAVDFVLVDARREMAEEFCSKAIFANARYENKYPLVSALSRPVIVRHLVDQARKFNAQAVAHGCTGKGNDQVRFEVGTHALAPDLEVLAPDPAAVDLAEAAKIIAGGAGLGSHDEFATLARVAEAIGASVGATRVVTDGGILGHARQIGTTGATVRPRLYVALGISGAAQHVGGIGEPLHVVSVNLDASCPMMAMADLAVVSDAAATLEALADLLGLRDGALVGEHASAEGDDD